MLKDELPPPATLLNYATPVIRHTRPIMGAIAVVAGIVMGLLSLSALWGTIIAIFMAVYIDRGLNPNSDLLAIILLLACIFCGYICVRWCRPTNEMIRGKVIHVDQHQQP